MITRDQSPIYSYIFKCSLDKYIIRIKRLLHRSLANDFALLFTESEFDLAEHIDTVCLPQVVLMMTLMMVVIVMTLMEMILALALRWILF